MTRNARKDGDGLTDGFRVTIESARPQDAVAEAGPSGSASWSAELTATVFVWLMGGLALLGVVLYALPLPMAGPEDRADAQFSAVIGLALIVLGLVVLALYFRTRVVIDEHGFRLESSWFHVPLKRIACGSIRSVETAFIRPGEWGGWGYRVMIGRSAFVVKAGSGLVIEMREGKLFAITIPDADGAATPFCAKQRPRNVSSSTDR